jgi:excisionase family DNA binding protein
MQNLSHEGAGSIALSIKEACRLSSLGRTKLYQLISTNALPSYKIGRRRVVFRQELEQALKKSLPHAGRAS